ncbi:MAG: alpha/beta hydrolase [Candidatus Omnitrophica bacterium]|nr:alpha/beta hydrolase [Candidatus Omnitrophota bacterium]
MVVIRFPLIIIAVICVFFFYLKFLERKAIYFPQKEIEVYPSAIGLPYEEVNFSTEDNLGINGWFIRSPIGRYTILFLHGNSGNISGRLEKIRMLYELGLNVYIIDYRGYGKSKGSPQEAGFYKDAVASYRYLREKYNILPEQIILYGESLGTAVAIDLATREKIGGIILEGTFSRGRDMAKKIYPFLPNFVFANSYDSLTKIRVINVPKLFLHSRQDEVVPVVLAQKLFSAANHPKYFVELNGGHNTAFLDSSKEYLTAISEFIKAISK